MAFGRLPASRVAVGVQGGGFNGIDVYAEQIALAAASTGLDVTLFATGSAVADQLRSRMAPARVRIRDIGLPEATRANRWLARLSHGQAMHRLEKAFASALAQYGPFDLVHLNHPALAVPARPHARMLSVAAWFYPHAPIGRLVETFRHTRGATLRRLALTAKALTYYLGDSRGFRAADLILAPTELLVQHLSAQGFEARLCAPPAHCLCTPAPRRPKRPGEPCRLVACAGDLSHPRKNIRDALRALAYLAHRGRRVRLELIGRHQEALRGEVANLPASAELVSSGPQPPAEVHRRMSEADLLVLPSLFEEWGYVAVEALLLGTPVVTYPVYPFPWMLDGGLGVVAEQQTPESLAFAIERALSGACLPDLAQAALSRFGPEAAGVKLAEAWGLPARAPAKPAVG